MALLLAASSAILFIQFYLIVERHKHRNALIQMTTDFRNSERMRIQHLFLLDSVSDLGGATRDDEHLASICDIYGILEAAFSKPMQHI